MALYKKNMLIIIPFSDFIVLNNLRTKSYVRMSHVEVVAKQLSGFH